MTPAFIRIGPYRFFFYARDRGEPRHVHVRRDKQTAKFWLDPVRIDHSRGFSRRELATVGGLIEEHAEALRRRWDEYFHE